jgi:DNA-binding transcriptional MocR family regulator
MPALQTTQFTVPEDLIDLGIGQPSLSLLPVAALREAAAHRLGLGDPQVLQYGAAQGDGYFRRTFARFLAEHHGVPTEADQLLITCGVSQALDLICTRLTRPGDTIFVEEPTYFLALLIFRDYRLNVVGIPMDANGLIPEALEDNLRKHRPAFLYTIPAFHNPSAVTLSAKRREKLVGLSQEHGFTIVADEVYQMLNYTTAPPPPLAAHVGTGTVLSLGSFSKILAPGLRLGWIQAASARLESLVHAGLVESGGGLSPFTSAIVHSVLELGLQEKCLAHLKAVYAARAAAMTAAVRRHLPESVEVTEPAGGLFLWMRLGGRRDAQELLAAARGHQVSFQPGSKFSSAGGLRDCLRLSFAYYEAEQLVEGVVRLGRALGS